MTHPSAWSSPTHRAFIDNCLTLHNEGRLDQYTASMAKLNSTELAWKICDEAVCDPTPCRSWILKPPNVHPPSYGVRMAGACLSCILSVSSRFSQVQLHGGAGYMWEYPVTRNLADVRVSRIYGGSNEIMKELIARSIKIE